MQFEWSRLLKLPKCISRPFLSCFVSIKKFLQKIQIDFYPAKIKLLIFLVSKILFLLMERCTIRVLMLMQCNSPKGCWRFQGFSSISTSILAWDVLQRKQYWTCATDIYQVPLKLPTVDGSFTPPIEYIIKGKICCEIWGVFWNVTLF